MKVIFLDIDGVLNTAFNCKKMALSKGPSCDDYGILFDPEAVKYLKRIIEETGAEIVISSSWKYTYPYQEFLRMWEDRDLPGSVIDVTPNVSKHRGDDIDQWLRECGHVTDYVIIDDLDSTHFNARQDPHLVFVDGYYGLDENAAHKAIGILNYSSIK